MHAYAFRQAFRNQQVRITKFNEKHASIQE
jgi:hypothetical protein